MFPDARLETPLSWYIVRKIIFWVVSTRNIHVCDRLTCFLKIWLKWSVKALTSNNGSPFHAGIFTLTLEHLSFSHLVLDTQTKAVSVAQERQCPVGVGRGRDAVKNVFLLGFVCLNEDHQELSPKVQLFSLVLLPSHSAATVLWISEAG